MSTIPAIFEHGVFRPMVPVRLPEGTHVDIPAPVSAATRSLNGPNPLQTRPAGESDEWDDLQWADLEYESVPLPHAGYANVRFETRGKLIPMVHDLDEE